MSLGRLLQLAALLWVTWVMLSSFAQEPTMLFQFGGLALGGLVFWLGWLIGGGSPGGGGGGAGGGG